METFCGDRAVGAQPAERRTYPLKPYLGRVARLTHPQRHETLASSLPLLANVRIRSLLPGRSMPERGPSAHRPLSGLYKCRFRGGAVIPVWPEYRQRKAPALFRGRGSDRAI